MDRGTIIRTLILLIALANQFLAVFGKSPLPISDELVEMLVSSVFTTVAGLIAWFENNYITSKGKKQKEVIERHRLD